MAINDPPPMARSLTIWQCEFMPGASVCAHCSQRGLACSGRSPDAGIQFRDENEVARRNSERARRDGKGAIMLEQQLDILQPQSNTNISTDVQNTNETREDQCTKRYKPWLRDPFASAVSEPLRRDFEERAVERFFIDWVLHPSNRGNTPGHFSDLPALYASAPEGSALWHAVRAVAFADMKNCPDGEVPFYIKARRNYGAALSRIRIAAADEQANANDRFLAALLLVDSFEVCNTLSEKRVFAITNEMIHLVDVPFPDRTSGSSRRSRPAHSP